MPYLTYFICFVMQVMLPELVLGILAVVLLGAIQPQSSAAIVAEAVIVKDNVVFYKTNEVSTTRAKWLATLVIDFYEFEYFMSKVAEDIDMAKALLEVSNGDYMKHNEDFEAF